MFKGTRLPVATVIENFEDLSIDEVIEQFDVTREQVTAVLEFVAESLRSEVPTGARPVLTTARRRGWPARCLARELHGAGQGLGHTQQRHTVGRPAQGRDTTGIGFLTCRVDQ